MESVTRVEIADCVRQAFQGEEVLVSAVLVSAARARGARPEVLSTLELLDGRYCNVRELWADLPDIPVGA